MFTMAFPWLICFTRKRGFKPAMLNKCIECIESIFKEKKINSFSLQLQAVRQQLCRRRPTPPSHTRALVRIYFLTNIYNEWAHMNKSVFLQVARSAAPRAATCSSTTCPRSLGTPSWCRCSSPSATSSAPRCSSTAPPTRASASASSASTTRRAPRRRSRRWTDSRSGWSDWRFSWKGQKIRQSRTRRWLQGNWPQKPIGPWIKFKVNPLLGLLCCCDNFFFLQTLMPLDREREIK